VAGQAFQQAFAGFSSKTYGTITFGRQNTTLTDGIAKYDPNYAPQAFSLIGLSGTTAGGGDTEDRRLGRRRRLWLPPEFLRHGRRCRLQ
jgi:predicted porin